MAKARAPKQIVSKKTTTTKKQTPWYWILALLIIATITFLYFWLQTPSTPQFDEKRAFNYLVSQTDFGARTPNSEAHEQCKNYLIETLKGTADEVSTQTFTYQDKHDSTLVYKGTNIIASFNLSPENNQRILLGAHWDTRPFADQDPNPEKRNQPVLGANDGASGVAVLLELAQVFKEYPPDTGIDIILFDLEDLGEDGGEQYPDSLNQFCIGSKHFVETNPSYKPLYGILLDMVGDKDLRIPQEQYSLQNARSIVEIVWNAAEAVGATAFVRTPGNAIYDDHIPFLQKGIRMIDLIDFEYPHWHTTNDTPDKCSPNSLKQVGETLLHLIYS